MSMTETIAVGADIGGSHITAALVDLERKIIVPDSLVRKKIASDAPADAIISEWSKTIKTVASLTGQPIRQLGIAMPGPFDYINGISLIKDQNKYQSLYNLDIKKLLAEKLEIDPDRIIFKNDAACFLQGELFSGSLKDYRHAACLTLGTGLGTAFAVDQVAADASLWNMPFRSGIAEDYISTRWFVDRYKELFKRSAKDVRELMTMDHDAAEILFKEFADNLGAFIHEMIKMTNPEAIVIGGNISNANGLFLSQVKTKVRDLTGQEMVITTTALGEYAALIGAVAN